MGRGGRRGAWSQSGVDPERRRARGGEGMEGGGSREGERRGGGTVAGG